MAFRLTRMSTDAAPLDLLIRHATVLTGEPDAAPITGGIIGIRGDRLTVVGPAPKDDTALPAARRVIDATGHVATPGFVNVHTHACLTLARGMTEDLGFAPAYTPGVPHFGDLLEDEAVALARLGALELLGFGSTLINDMYAHAHATLPAMAELGLRVSSAVWLHDVDFARVHERVWDHHPAIGERTLRFGTELADRWQGGFDGRTSVMLAPHAIDTCSLGFLREVAGESDRRGLRVMTHLAQSRIEVEQVRRRDGMTPAGTAAAAGLLHDRLIAAHCVVMTPEDIANAGAAGITVAHAPKINLTGGYLPVTSALGRAGARVALATDNMHGDMAEVMRWALVAGRLQDAEITPDWTPRRVFEMATLGAARALGRDDDLGSLAVGKKADIVLFDFRRAHLTPAFDPLATLVHTGQGRDVATVIVDGRIVVEHGRATLVDDEAIRRDGERAARALWQRVAGERFTRAPRTTEQAHPSGPAA